MSYTAGSVTSDEITYQAAGKPCFCGRNAMEAYQYVPEWSTADNWTSSTDSVDADYPTTRLFDRVFDLDTRPTGTASTWHLLCDLEASGNEIDTVLINQSIGDCISAGSVAVIVTIADDADFTVNAVDIVGSGDWTILPGATGNQRLRWIDLDGASARYTNVRFVRISFIGTGTGNFIPQVSEFWLGRRRQLRRAPNSPHDPSPVESKVQDLKSEVGGTFRYVLAQEQIIYDGTWVLTPDESDLATFAALKNDTSGFNKPFAYWLGTDSLVSFAWLLADPKYSRPFQNSAERGFSLAAVELTPFLFPEVEAAS